MEYLNENNTLNWLQFMAKILPNQDDVKCLRKFIRRESGTSHDWTSRNIYMKYCK